MIRLGGSAFSSDAPARQGGLAGAEVDSGWNHRGDDLCGLGKSGFGSVFFSFRLCLFSFVHRFSVYLFFLVFLSILSLLSYTPLMTPFSSRFTKLAAIPQTVHLRHSSIRLPASLEHGPRLQRHSSIPGRLNPPQRRLQRGSGLPSYLAVQPATLSYSPSAPAQPHPQSKKIRSKTLQKSNPSRIKNYPKSGAGTLTSRPSALSAPARNPSPVFSA